MLSVILQIVLVIVFWNVQQRSDPESYIRIATDYYNRGEWYPEKKELYSNYLFAPGLINYFILQLKVFGTLKLNPIFNIMMNCGILYYIFILSKKIFSPIAAYISIIIWCILYSNIMIVISAGTEIPFLFIVLSASCLCIFKNKYPYLLLAGILFILGNWIRPLALIFVISIIVYFIFNRYSWESYGALISSMIITIIFIGSFTNQNTGLFFFQSSTSGVNLIMTANDKSYGGVATNLFKDTTSLCYIKNASSLTFIEKDSIWKERAITWIKKHPTKYLFLYVKKIAGLFIEDSWPDRPILGGDGVIGNNLSNKMNKGVFFPRCVHMISRSMSYYIILVLFIIGIIKYFRFYNIKQHIFLISVLILGIGITCIFSVSPRYHYPFLFVIVLYTGSMIDKTFFDKKNDKIII